MRMSLVFSMYLVVFVPVFAAGQTSPYVGYRYKPVSPGTLLPNGLKSLGGSLIGDINAKPVWGISLIARGHGRMLWLEREIRDGPSGIEEWEVQDVLIVPNFAKGNDVLFGYTPMECTYNGKPRSDLVVYVRFLPRSQSYRTINAWRADIASGKFVPLNRRLAKCNYETP